MHATWRIHFNFGLTRKWQLEKFPRLGDVKPSQLKWLVYDREDREGSHKKTWRRKGKGTTESVAAGKIHSDIEKGFIRDEVVAYDDMIRYKGRVAANEAGKARF